MLQGVTKACCCNITARSGRTPFLKPIESQFVQFMLNSEFIFAFEFKNNLFLFKDVWIKLSGYPCVKYI